MFEAYQQNVLVDAIAAGVVNGSNNREARAPREKCTE